MPRVDMIATRLLSQLPRMAMAEGQKRLSQAQAEAATGRHWDVGLALGARTGSTISLRLELDSVTSSIDRAGQASHRAGVTQISLSALSELARGFQSMLAGARNAENGKNLAATSGLSALEALHVTLSTTHDGQFIFSGLMTETAPLTPYTTGPRQAVIAAFESAFGFPPSDPAAHNLSGAEIQNFLDGPFSALFEDTEWKSTWSTASDDGPTFRIGVGDAVDLQANANQPFARTLVQAFSMVEVLGQSNISLQAFETVADRALSLVTEAQLQVGVEQARIGTGESRLKLTIQSLQTAKTRYSSAIQALEGVDTYEAATRVNFLMTQLETSYALTGRINRMSLLSFI